MQWRWKERHIFHCGRFIQPDCLSAACRDLLHLFSDTVQSESGFGGKFHVSVYCMVHPVAAADIKWKNI